MKKHRCCCCCVLPAALFLFTPQAATSGDFAGLLSAAPVVAVTAATTLEQVIEILAVKGLHRVYVVDGAQKAVSIITLTDVLRLVTKAPTKPAEQRVVEMDEDDDDDDEDDE